MPRQVSKTSFARNRRAREAMRLRQQGMRVGEIARRLGVTRWAVGDYLRDVAKENRRREKELLPEFVRMFLEGHTADDIAATLHVSKELVEVSIGQYPWFQDLQNRIAKLEQRLHELDGRKDNCRAEKGRIPQFDANTALELSLALSKMRKKYRS